MTGKYTIRGSIFQNVLAGGPPNPPNGRGASLLHSFRANTLCIMLHFTHRMVLVWHGAAATVTSATEKWAMDTPAKNT